MPTQRDGAAYKRQYRRTKKEAADLSGVVVGYMLRNYLRNCMPVYPDQAAARIDAYTDILMERGLCSSVLSWHTRPARAADDLEW